MAKYRVIKMTNGYLDGFMGPTDKVASEGEAALYYTSDEAEAAIKNFPPVDGEVSRYKVQTLEET